jgi:hypothetical protein
VLAYLQKQKKAKERKQSRSTVLGMGKDNSFARVLLNLETKTTHSKGDKTETIQLHRKHCRVLCDIYDFLEL